MTIHSHDTQIASGIATTTTTTTTITTGVDVNTQMINEQFFVDPVSGDDSYSGHEGSPWKTIAKVNAAALVPGDQVFLPGGVTTIGKLAPVTSGDVNRYILYGSYGVGRATIDGSADNAFDIINQVATNLRVENIIYSGTGTAARPTARAYTHDIYFYNCDFNDSSDGIGLAMDGASGTFVHSNTVDSCHASGNHQSGFFASTGENNDSMPSGILFVNCTSHDNGVHPSGDHGFYVKFNCIIRDSIAYNNMYSGFKANCETFHTNPYGPIIDRCYAYGNDTGYYAAHEKATFRNNLAWGNDYASMTVDPDCHNSNVLFNTLVNAVGDSGLQFTTGTSGVHGNAFKNNLFIQDKAVNNYRQPIAGAGTCNLDTIQANNTFDYNVYYYTTSAAVGIISDQQGHNWTFAQWKALSNSPDAHGTQLLALPDFVTRYTDLHPADAGNLKLLGLCMLGYQQDKDEIYRAEPPTPGCYDSNGS